MGGVGRKRARQTDIQTKKKWRRKEGQKGVKGQERQKDRRTDGLMDEKTNI